MQMTGKEDSVIKLCGKVAMALVESGADLDQAEALATLVGKISHTDIVCQVDFYAIYVYLNKTSKMMVFTPRHNRDDLSKVTAIKDLIENSNHSDVSFKEFNQQITELLRSGNTLPLIPRLLGFGLTSLAMVLFFNVTIPDVIVTVVVSLLLFILQLWLSNGNMSQYIQNTISVFCVSFLVLGLTKLGIANDSFKIIIGACLPLLPVVSIVNFVREVFKRRGASIERAMDVVMLLGSQYMGLLVATIFAHTIGW